MLIFKHPDSKSYNLRKERPSSIVFCGWYIITLHCRHKERDGVSNHQRLDCLLNLFFRRRSKKTSKHRVIGHCEGNPPVTGGFPSQRASHAENVSIWWRHHERLRKLPINFKPLFNAFSFGNIADDIFRCTRLKEIEVFGFQFHRRLFVRFQLTIVAL